MMRVNIKLKPFDVTYGILKFHAPKCTDIDHKGNRRVFGASEALYNQYKFIAASEEHKIGGERWIDLLSIYKGKVVNVKSVKGWVLEAIKE